MEARAAVALQRLPLEARRLLRTTDTPIGAVLGRLLPRRNTLHWNVMADPDDPEAELLVVRARVDAHGVPLACVEEHFHLATLTGTPSGGDQT